MNNKISPLMFIAGIDEAGRGPLAGPVTAATVCLPENYSNLRINDSKKLTESIREELFDEIQNYAIAFSVVFVSPREIEKLNIRQATLKAMQESAKAVSLQLENKFGICSVHFLVDGNFGLGEHYSSEAIIKGDQKNQSIAAASILAKVSRDREMQKLDKAYPGYGLAIHKGYPTKFHLEKIAEFGPTQVHRRTFAGVKEFL
jgi:ribonuclease HII